MDLQPFTLALLGFQALVTLLLALVYLGLWWSQREAYFLTWASAWGLYAARLGCISMYLVTQRVTWLLVHQLATGGTALLLLGAALQFSRGTASRVRPLGFGIAAVLWVGVSLYGV